MIYWTAQNTFVMLAGYVSKKENTAQYVMRSIMTPIPTILVGNNVALAQTGHISHVFKNHLDSQLFLDILASYVRTVEE